MGAFALGTAGCIVAADLLNPTLADGLGIPTVSGARSGSVVVRLTNQTRSFALMSVLVSYDEANPQLVTEQSQVPLEPGESQDLVIDCPLVAVYPAGLTNGNSTFTLPSAAATVQTGENAMTDVQYTGAAPLEGTVFQCGDLVQFRLFETTGGDGFRVVVQVFRGS